MVRGYEMPKTLSSLYAIDQKEEEECPALNSSF
jgi:hypothetical protein